MKILKYWGDITMEVPLQNYWGGGMSPLSHRDRRPWLRQISCDEVRRSEVRLVI